MEQRNQLLQGRRYAIHVYTRLEPIQAQIVTKRANNDDVTNFDLCDLER
jgi:hypothetical protein